MGDNEDVWVDGSFKQINKSRRGGGRKKFRFPGDAARCGRGSVMQLGCCCRIVE